jgi:Rod binding domain-containing protein
MFSSDPSALPAPRAAGQNLPAPAAQTADSADARKLKQAAGDFESILLASMWKSMKQSFGTSEADSDPAHGTLDDWGIEIMSGAVGRAGGLGLGKLLLQHLQPALHEHAAAGAVGDPVEPGQKK